MGAKNDGVNTTNEVGEGVKHFRDYPNDAGFADVPETRTPIELKVTGNIPSYVRGVLYRTGPGSFTTPMNNGQIFKIQHWYSFIGGGH
jgi:torulene dioxygenase